MKTKLIIAGDEVDGRIKALGKQIAASYSGGDPLLCLCVLRGAVIFYAQLMRAMAPQEVIFDFIRVSSYEGTVSAGKVKLLSGLREEVAGRKVLVVEDVVDSGRTVSFLRSYLKDAGAAEVKVACLIDKPFARKTSAKADFVAFTLDRPVFIVGYGLDCEQRFRNLDGIYEVNE